MIWTGYGQKPGRWYDLTVGGRIVARVRHCGHPTANWPYYIDADPIIVASNGHGFRLLVEAKQAAESLYMEGKLDK